MELLVLDQQNRKKQLLNPLNRQKELLGINIDMEQERDAATFAMDVSGAGAEPTK